jgi:hypothetical protein
VVTVRFATFNVENLFSRPRAFNQATWALGEPILDAFREFNSLIARAVYSPAEQARMIDLLLVLEVYIDTGGVLRRKPTWAWLRANWRDFEVERKATGHRDRRCRPGELDRLARALRSRAWWAASAMSVEGEMGSPGHLSSVATDLQEVEVQKSERTSEGRRGPGR